MASYKHIPILSTTLLTALVIFAGMTGCSGGSSDKNAKDANSAPDIPAASSGTVNPGASSEPTKPKSSVKNDDLAATPEPVAEPTPDDSVRSDSPVKLDDNNKKYNIVKVYYGTDRNKTNKKALNDYFGHKRSPVSYGQIDVSIPFNHKVGNVESPSLWRLEFSEDPEKHISLLTLVEMKKSAFLQNINYRLLASNTNSAFIFFHGYNVDFPAAAKRTAQIAHDLKFQGLPLFYSWPSVGRVSAYTKDEANIQWSESNIKTFLLDVSTDTEIKNIYLIAHSMGNRGLTRALGSLLTEHPELKSKFKEVILTAPDIDAQVFKRDILPMLTRQGLPITLYASADDVALLASKKVHGYPRAGDAGDKIVVAEGVETIDATGLDTGFLKHSYFSETQPVLKDIQALTIDQLRASQRKALEKVTDEGYWKFRQ